jgi:hypothetical protein
MLHLLAAAVYGVCGKPDKAIAQLRHSAETGLPNHRWLEPFVVAG